MANNLLVNPLSLDTDLASFQAVQTLTSQSELLGLKIRKIALVAKSTSVAGTVSVTDPISGCSLLAPMVVASGQVAGTIVYFDEFVHQLTWSDFKITGLTGTATILYVWFGY